MPGVVNVYGPPSGVVVLDGDTFCTSDAAGDVDPQLGAQSGFYCAATRFLSRYTLTLDGDRLEPLSAGSDEHFRASFHLVPRRGKAQVERRRGELTVVRRRFVAGNTLEDTLEVVSYAAEPLELELELSFAADFAPLGKHGEGEQEMLAGQSRVVAGQRSLQIEDGDPSFQNITQITFSEELQIDDSGRARWPLRLGPAGEAVLKVHVVALAEGEHYGLDATAGDFDVLRRRTVSEHESWSRRLPELETRLPHWQPAYERALADLTALRFREPRTKLTMLAAGLPWFMTVFGRDSLITALQTMVLGPETAQNVLRVLATLQADADLPAIDAEPGKIIHELRRGKKAASWFAAYYGTVDATPLYLILLSELYRWSGDAGLVRELEGSARAALRWIIDWGDQDGDGFIEFLKRAPQRGLSVQTWKDSQHSQVFRDGRLAQAPLAAAEVQGYVYDAFRRTAELARDCWSDPALAQDLEARAARLQQQFERAFWLPERRAYAMALDRDKTPVDGLASNMGHLLWSGILSTERAAEVAARLLEPPLFSGWGLRTLAAGEGGYNPLVYHNGCVWPHDTSLAAWGLARYGQDEAAARLIGALLDASSLFHDQLPELFAGYDRDEEPYPVAYPSTCKPQAWAAGVPVLWARLLLGLEPDLATRRLRARPLAPLRSALEGTSLSGVRAYGRRYDVTVQGGRAEVHEQ